MCFHETSELKDPFSCIQSFWISKWFWIGHCIDSLAKEPKETQKDPKTNPKTNGTDSTTNANQLQRAVALRKSPKFSKLGGHHPTSNLALSCTVLSGRTIWFFGLSASTDYPPSSERLSAHCPIYCQRHSIFKRLYDGNNAIERSPSPANLVGALSWRAPDTYRAADSIESADCLTSDYSYSL